MAIFAIVVICWVFSVCLHEFGHAWVAERGGDYTVREKGYLSMNPIHYTHPVTSFILPMVFMATGGIGLPGGAVYIENHLLRSRAWNTWVSLAGPAMNLILVFIITVLLKLVFIPHYPNNEATYALAFLLELQICAVLFNLIPFPPLDGFQALEPWLPEGWVHGLKPLNDYGLFVIFFIFRAAPNLNHAFWDIVYWVLGTLGIDGEMAWTGYQAFQFWKH
ncbi:MAG: site-2 protease family protein [Pedosphaera sp.]|nr:site-2 protease family protein [Pedosphaera sp.]